MMSSKKKKIKDDTDGDSDWRPKKTKTEQSDGNCIIHMKESNMATFTFLNSKNKASVTTKLKEIAEKRLKEDRGSAHGMENISEHFLANVDSITENTHGYHRDCYQRLTSNLNRLKSVSDDDGSANVKRSQRKSGDKEKVIFNPDCIFCNKEGKISIKKNGYKTT